MNMSTSPNRPMAVAEDDVPSWHLNAAAPVGPQVYASLRRYIIRGELRPGTAVSEAEIARRFSTSRQPVREAFIKLAEDGLLEVRPQRGSFVRKISKAAVIDARFVREAIEADIVRELAREGDAALVAQLRALLAEQAALPSGRMYDFMKLDEQFHLALARGAGRSYGWKVIEDVKIQMDRVRYLTLRNFPQERLIRQHTSIVDAIERKSPDVADREMRRHLRGILDDLPSIEDQHPDFFTATG